MSDEASRGLDASPRGRRLLFFLLYFSEGAPMGFIWWAMPVRLRTAGVAPDVIASLLATLVLPWALKFLWAPAIDAFRSRRFTVRGWILAAQAVMCLTLLPLLVLDPVSQLGWIRVALLAHACAAATQDAGIDSLAIARVPASERGAVNGYMQVGMLSARALFGGGALLLASRVSGNVLVLALMGAIASSAAVLLLGVSPSSLAVKEGPIADRLAETRAALRAMVSAPVTWLGFAFAATAGAGFKSMTALAGTFLVDQGASEQAVGRFFLLPAVACMAAGAWLGGRAADRLPRTRVVAVAELGAALAVATVGAASGWWWHLPVGSLFVLMAILYFTIGVATSASYALFMDLTDPRLAATQFCVFMAGINLCEAWSTRTLGALIAPLGYGRAIALMALPSVVALALLPALARRLRVARPMSPT
jgi:MFS transporter, PAT family, beta-lactamase induction signal transducer AmpG